MLKLFDMHKCTIFSFFRQRLIFTVTLSSTSSLSLPYTLPSTLTPCLSHSHYGAQAVVVSVDPKRVYVTSPEAAPKGKYVRYSIVAGCSHSNLLTLIELYHDVKCIMLTCVRTL
jgi:hypothetical protein